MTFSINGTDIGQIVESVAWVASIVATLVVVLIVYLMVRPPRHVRDRRKAPPPPALDAAEAEQLWQLVERMEARLAVLERALAADREQRILAPAEDGRDSGRKQ